MEQLEFPFVLAEERERLKLALVLAERSLEHVRRYKQSFSYTDLVCRKNKVESIKKKLAELK